MTHPVPSRGRARHAGLLLALTLPVAALAAETPVRDVRPVESPPPAGPRDQDLEEMRQRLDAAVREVAELSARLGARMGDRFTERFVPPRSVIGVQVQPNGAGDAARVTAVSPGGAAQAAGVREGDEILAIAGRELRGQGDNPAAALSAIIRDLEPEKAVKLKFRRDGREREVEVTPRPAPRMQRLAARPAAGIRFAGPPGDFPAVPVPGQPVVLPFEHHLPLAGMELATLSERLGSYFGAKEGVLVVRAGDLDAWQLQDGDVILSIDGRRPENAAHATRILRSYQRGEKVKLEVLRERRNRTLDVTLPGGPAGG